MFEFRTRLDQILPFNLGIYFIILAVSGLVVYRRIRKDALSLLVVLLFYESIFDFLGITFLNIQKILVFIVAMFLFWKHFNKNNISKNDAIIIIMMITFFGFFLISYFLNPVSINFAFSQFFKYLFPFLLILALKHAIEKGIDIEYYYNLLIFLFKIQIAYSVLKLFLLGFNEAIVGSVALRGGAVAALLPVFGFILIWLKNEKRFTSKEWIFIVALLIISIVSNKRAIWFILPIFITYFYFFLGKRISLSKTIIVLTVAPLIFYFGVRFNPTLNKEGKIWGSFDLQYVLDYTDNYTTGGDRHSNTRIGYGRTGGNQILVEKAISDPYNLSNMFGNGLNAAYSVSYAEFEHQRFTLSSKSATSGMGSFFIANGYFGVFALMFLGLSLCLYIKETRIRIIFMLFFLLEFIFYAGVIFNSRTLSALFVICIIFIRYREQLLKQRYEKDAGF
jgi:hypothetical protein